MLLKQIKEILGGDISTKNTKMPGTSFGLSTDFCQTGGKLRDIPGSVCEKCYAARLEAFRPSVKKGWSNRAVAVQEACRTPEGQVMWINAMVERLSKLNPTHHRWHDSGDLQSDVHLSMILMIATRLPHIKFWLPTKESAIIKRASKVLGKFGGIPDNLCIRLSAPMIHGDESGQTGVYPIKVKGIQGSMVFTTSPDTPCWICPARYQENSCKDCRACWDKDIDLVAYPKH